MILSTRQELPKETCIFFIPTFWYCGHVDVNQVIFIRENEKNTMKKSWNVTPLTAEDWTQAIWICQDSKPTEALTSYKFSVLQVISAPCTWHPALWAWRKGDSVHLKVAGDSFSQATMVHTSEQLQQYSDKSHNVTPLSGKVWTWTFCVQIRAPDWTAYWWLNWFADLTSTQMVQVQTPPLSGVTLQDITPSYLSFSGVCIHTVCAILDWLKASPATMRVSRVTYPSWLQCGAEVSCTVPQNWLLAETSFSSPPDQLLWLLCLSPGFGT